MPFCVFQFDFQFHVVALSRSFSLLSIFFIGHFAVWQWAQTGHLFQSVLAAMQGLQLSYPPAQFNFQITFGADSVVPIERLFWNLWCWTLGGHFFLFKFLVTWRST